MKWRIAGVLFFTLTCLLAAQSITVTSPNGGESWEVGSTHDITWSTANINSGQFRIYLFDGSSNLGTIAMYLPASQHSFTWTVGHLIDAPDVGVGSNYKIKIRVISEAPNDLSDAPFSITSSAAPPGSIVVTSPNSGEVWPEGASRNLSWNSPGITSGNVVITLLKGGIHAGIIASSVSVTDHTYLWTVGSTDAPFPGAGANYRVQVQLEGGTASDFSDGPFSITVDEPPPASISITKPNGGEYWTVGQNESINWTTSNIDAGTVRLDLFKNNSNLGPIQTGIPVSQGSFSWTVDNMGSPLGDHFKVRIQLEGGTLSDHGDAYFHIILPQSVRMPDLYISDQSIAPKPRAMGDVITYRVKVNNKGEAAAPQHTASLVTYGPKGFQTRRRTVKVPAVLVNRPEVVTYKYKLPRMGIYRNEFTLNPENEFAEKNPGDNKSQITYTVDPLPDLIACVDHGKRPRPGKSVTIHFYVKNIGPCRAPPSTMKTYASDCAPKWHDVPALDSGQIFMVVRSSKWYDLNLYKNILIDCIANCGNKVRELNSENNHAKGWYYLTRHGGPHGTKGLMRCSTSGEQNRRVSELDQTKIVNR